MVRGKSAKSGLTHKGLRITHYQTGSEPRKFVQLDGISPDFKLGIYNRDINTLACSLLERMYYCKVNGEFLPPPKVNRVAVFNTLKPFKRALLRNCGRAPWLTLQQVVDTYTGRKRTIYENAMKSVLVNPVNRRDAYSKAFVKVEKGKLGSAPRGIQPRDPRYNIALGKYIKPLEYILYKGIARVFGDGPTVMKGYNVSQIGSIVRGKWNSFHNPVAIGLDAVKFDMHVSREMLEFEHSIYNSMMDSPELRKLLSWQLDNKGAGYCPDGKLKYSVRGRRFSGDMNTALGNCVIMCALVYCYAKSKDIPVKLINNGDDCTVFMERHHEHSFIQGHADWFIKMGFRMTMEPPVYQIEHIEFCQMHPVVTPSGVVMVRNFKKSLAKDTIALVNIENEQSARTWLKAIGDCGLALTSGIPVMQEFYKKLAAQSSQSSNIMQSTAMQSGFLFLTRGMVNMGPTHVHPSTRVSFMTAFGVTPDEQVAYENKIRHLNIDYLLNADDSLPPNHFEI